MSWHCLLCPFNHAQNLICYAFIFLLRLFSVGMISFSFVTKASFSVIHFMFSFSFCPLYHFFILFIYFSVRFVSLESISYCNMCAACCFLNFRSLILTLHITEGESFTSAATYRKPKPVGNIPDFGQGRQEVEN